MAAGPNPLILWPIRFTAATYVLRCTQNGTTTDLAFPSSGSLTVGRNYWVSGDGQADADGGVNGVGDLLQMLDDTMTSHSSSYTFTVSLTSNMLVSVESSNHADAWSILWSHANTTLDEAVFGFAASDTASSWQAIGTLLPKGMWRPEAMVKVDSRDRQPIVASVGTSISGFTRTSWLAAPKKIRDLDWGLLPQAKALIEYQLAAEPFGSSEYMLTNSAGLGRPLRYYADETSRTSTSYGLYGLRKVDHESAQARDEAYRLRWASRLELRRFD